MSDRAAHSLLLELKLVRLRHLAFPVMSKLTAPDTGCHAVLGDTQGPAPLRLPWMLLCRIRSLDRMSFSLDTLV